jgi:hypothetical protein
MLKIKKIFSIILICSTLLFPLHFTSAGYWSENYSANAIKQLLEEIELQVHETIASGAHMAAIEQTTSTLNSLLYDGSSPRNIGNYYDFMIKEPNEVAVSYTENFLTEMMRGTSSGDYISGSGYNDIITSIGESVIESKQSNEQITIDYDEKCSNISENNYFSQGIDCFTAIISNPANMPITTALITDTVYKEAYEAEQLIKKEMANTSGVIPTVDENGDVQLPSSVVEELQLQQIKLPLEALATGDTNVFATAIQSVAVTMITEIVIQGISRGK